MNGILNSFEKIRIGVNGILNSFEKIRIRVNEILNSFKKIRIRVNGILNSFKKIRIRVDVACEAYRKIPKISPSMYKPLQIKVPQTGNAKNPPLNCPSKYKLPPGLVLGKLPSNTN